jgi:hypothetical protein
LSSDCRIAPRFEPPVNLASGSDRKNTVRVAGDFCVLREVCVQV